MIPRAPGDGPRDLSRPLEHLRLLADDRHAGKRLDQVLCLFLSWRSRTSIHRLLDEGMVTLADRPARASCRIKKGDVILVRIPQPPVPVDVAPGDFDIPILHEDPLLIAVDKPAGLPVHPSGRRVHGTLIHYLHKRYRRPDDPAHDVVPRLLHRIDRETSGVVAVGLDEQFHSAVRKQFEDRRVAKTYLAVVHGCPSPREGVIDLPIGPDKRSPIRLKLCVVREEDGLPAVTGYRVLRAGKRFSLVELRPETGRTHQIRVHMDAIGCPLVGDKIYGVAPDIFLACLDHEAVLSDEQRASLVLDRHALHSHRLVFDHPVRGKGFTLEAPLPGDLAGLVEG
ncbi:MAG: RluA family pseudouridine synthase [Planctomycetes bacterium]|nr:RluA family pseudouridine synthase [Planctomycetota bacterium]